MDSITRAGILLNAIKAPYEIFMKLCDSYDPDEITRGESFWDELKISKALQQRLSDLIYKDWAARELERTEKFNARFITAKNIDYPAKLKDLQNPPIGLYVKGNANISLPSIAIVGTRKCSDYARGVAVNLGKALAQKNIIVISGGARGIDSAGHRGCLSEDGITIAVFGTGINKIYPSENRDLFSRIIERGAIISEYPFDTFGEAWRFPERNRIIVGISSRIIVVESPDGGGAMLTARAGLKLGREVWAVPGRITDDVCRGTNTILGEGAKVFTGINDFIETVTGQEQFSMNFDDYLDGGKVKSTPELSDDDKIIYSLLQMQGGRTFDEILMQSKLDVVTVQSSLMNLEAEGLIITSSGRYSASA